MAGAAQAADLGGRNRHEACASVGRLRDHWASCILQERRGVRVSRRSLGVASLVGVRLSSAGVDDERGPAGRGCR